MNAETRMFTVSVGGVYAVGSGRPPATTPPMDRESAYRWAMALAYDTRGTQTWYAYAFVNEADTGALHRIYSIVAGQVQYVEWAA